MTDSNDQDHKKVLHLSGSGKGKLELKKPVDSTVRQSFSHGRSKTVTVEVKRKRAIEKGALPGVADGGAAARQAAQGLPIRSGSGRSGKGAQTIRQLTRDERETRLRALLAMQEEEQRRAEEDAIAAEEAAKAADEAEVVVEAVEEEPEVLDAETLRQRELEELRQIQEQERKEAEEAERKRQEEEAKRQEAEGARKAAEADRKSVV